MYLFVGLIVLILLTSIGAFAKSAEKPPPQTGLHGDRLRPCPSTPNCVCSEFPGESSFISPIKYFASHENVWKNALTTVQSMGGKIISKDSNYLHATFTSKLFRFIDDFELRLDKEQNVIHIRSASRTGYSDLGVNRKRVKQFRSRFSVEFK